jgi:glycosyltransferase involved in cell wall biosynthesis
MANAMGRASREILWSLDSSESLADEFAATRFMVALLRRRRDLRERFPNALSAGRSGPFANWLKSEEFEGRASAEQDAAMIDAAFDLDFTTKALAVARRLGAEPLEGDAPSWVSAVRLRGLAIALFQAVIDGDLEKEAAWWLLLTQNEALGIRFDRNLRSRESDASAQHGLLLVALIERTDSQSATFIESLKAVSAELGSIGGGIGLVISGASAADALTLPFDRDLLAEIRRHCPIEILVHLGSGRAVAAFNEATNLAREHHLDAVILCPGRQIGADCLRELREVAKVDPMIGFVSVHTDAIAAVRSSFLLEMAPESDDPAFDVRAYLPRFSYVSTAMGPALYIKAAMMFEFGVFDELYKTIKGALEEFIARCNRYGYRTARANHSKAFARLALESSDRESGLTQQAEDQERLSRDYPEYDLATERALASTEYRAQQLLYGFKPVDGGRQKLLLECSHLEAFFNGTFMVTTNLISRLVDEFSNSYKFYISCDKHSFAFHGLNRIDKLEYVGDLEEAKLKGPFTAAIKLAQPFYLTDVVNIGLLAPISVFLMHDTIAMDCQDLNENNLRSVWDIMVLSVSNILYVSQFSCNQFNNRICVPDTVLQTTMLLSTDPSEYIHSATKEKKSDYVLVVGNQHNHKYIKETLSLLLHHSKRPLIKVLGVELIKEDGLESYLSGQLSDELVDELYRNAAIVIYPTHYEGFGLPIMNALAYEKPVLVRAMPVFDEIRGRTPGGANIHQFGSTKEIVDFAIKGVSWIAGGTGDVDVQSWSSAAHQLEQAIALAQKNFSYDALYKRLINVQSCEAISAVAVAKSEAEAEAEAADETAQDAGWIDANIPVEKPILDSNPIIPSSEPTPWTDDHAARDESVQPELIVGRRARRMAHFLTSRRFVLRLSAMVKRWSKF